MLYAPPPGIQTMNTASSHAKAVAYIHDVLRANKEAGLAIEARHLSTILTMLETCDVSPALSPSCQQLDVSLAIEPASVVAKRLLNM